MTPEQLARAELLIRMEEAAYADRLDFPDVTPTFQIAKGPAGFIPAHTRGHYRVGSPIFASISALERFVEANKSEMEELL